MSEFETSSDDGVMVLPSRSLQPSSIQRGFSMSDRNYPTSSPKTPKGSTVAYDAFAFKCSNNLAALGDGYEYKTHNHWGPKHMETLPDGANTSVYGNYKYSCNSHDNCKAWVRYL